MAAAAAWRLLTGRTPGFDTPCPANSTCTTSGSPSSPSSPPSIRRVSKSSHSKSISHRAVVVTATGHHHSIVITPFAVTPSSSIVGRSGLFPTTSSSSTARFNPPSRTRSAHTRLCDCYRSLPSPSHRALPSSPMTVHDYPVERHLSRADDPQTRIPSPTPTEILDTNLTPFENAQLLHANGIKVRDFALQPPHPPPLSLASSMATITTATSLATVTPLRIPRTPEIFDPREGLSEYEFRLSQNPRIWPIAGKTLRRLLDLRWILENEPEHRWHEMDWEELRKFDARSTGRFMGPVSSGYVFRLEEDVEGEEDPTPYPWKVIACCAGADKIPSLEQRADMVKGRFKSYKAFDAIRARWAQEAQWEQEDQEQAERTLEELRMREANAREKQVEEEVLSWSQALNADLGDDAEEMEEVDFQLRPQDYLHEYQQQQKVDSSPCSLKNRKRQLSAGDIVMSQNGGGAEVKRRKLSPSPPPPSPPLPSPPPSLPLRARTPPRSTPAPRRHPRRRSTPSSPASGSRSQRAPRSSYLIQALPPPPTPPIFPPRQFPAPRSSYDPSIYPEVHQPTTSFPPCVSTKKHPHPGQIRSPASSSTSSPSSTPSRRHGRSRSRSISRSPPPPVPSSPLVSRSRQQRKKKTAAAVSRASPYARVHSRSRSDTPPLEDTMTAPTGNGTTAGMSTPVSTPPLTTGGLPLTRTPSPTYSRSRVMTPTPPSPPPALAGSVKRLHGSSASMANGNGNGNGTLRRKRGALMRTETFGQL